MKLDKIKDKENIWKASRENKHITSIGILKSFSADFSADKVDEFDAIAFGCPAMGDEVLEEDEFEPMFGECEAKLSGKKIGLFGSYGWGDGEWMRSWEDRVRSDGAVLVNDEGVTANEAPLDEDLEKCRALGKALVG